MDSLKRFSSSIINGLYRRKNSKFKNFRKRKNKKDSFNIKGVHLNSIYRHKKYVFPVGKENETKRKFLTITAVNLDPALQRITLNTLEELNPKYIYKLKIDYTGTAIVGSLKGLYGISHFNKQHETT